MTDNAREPRRHCYSESCWCKGEIVYIIPASIMFNVLDSLRLAHIYALKDSHLEELPEDFKPHKWDGYEIEYARNASNNYRKILDVMMAQYPV